MQSKLSDRIVYHSEPYNKIGKTINEQWVRLTDGCPNQCPYCYCPIDFKTYDIPHIEKTYVKIMDMNILQNPNGLKLINSLPEKNAGKVIEYELVCGIDFRIMTQDTANLLKRKRFKHIRFAWDWLIKDQYKIFDTIKYLQKAGYQRKDLMCFMICDWKIPYKVCQQKLEQLKVWGVQVDDCYYDNVQLPLFQGNYWTLEQCKEFRSRCRKHNQLIRHNGLDPEQPPQAAEKGQ